MVKIILVNYLMINLQATASLKTSGGKSKSE